MARLSHFHLTSVICIIVFIFLLPGCHLRAQDENRVTKSEVITVINGKEYYLHTVKKKETLYSIGRTYGYTPDEIVAENPEARNGLKTKQVLKIPVKPTESQNTGKIEGEKFIYHIVKEGQTVYSLSKLYNIEENEILKTNPGIQNGTLQLGQVVKIPKKSGISINTPVIIQKAPSKNNYWDHKVEAKETLYSLSKIYKVTVDDIINANPRLKSESLKIGETILIPQKLDHNPIVQNTYSDTVRPVATNNDTSLKYIVKPELFDPARLCDSLNVYCNPSFFRNSEKYKVAIILPFYSDENKRPEAFDTTSMSDESEESFRSGNWIYPKSINFLEFYEGFLLSVDSLRKTGLSIQLYVYDCGKDTNKIKQVLAKKEMQNVDLIIGPIFSEEVEIVGRFAKAKKINCVSPLSNKLKLIDNNPYLFQVNPSQETELTRTSKFLESYSNPNIIFLYNKDSIYSELQDVKWLKKSIISSYASNFKLIDTSKLKVLALNGTYNPDIKNLLNKDEENIIVLPSNNETFVMDVVSNLNTLLIEYKITLFGLPSWSKIKNVEPEYFFNLKLHYYTPFYVNYKDPQIKNFISKYHKTFNSEPYRIVSQGFNFSMLGYDVGFYFLSALENYGRNFQCCIRNFKSTGLLSNYSFDRVNKYSGFENDGLQYIIYNKDFTVDKVEKIP